MLDTTAHDIFDLPTDLSQVTREEFERLENKVDEMLSMMKIMYQHAMMGK